MTKRRSRSDKSPVTPSPSRQTTAALREQGLLFRCGQGAIQSLLVCGSHLSVFTATGAVVYPIEQGRAGPPCMNCECPCSCGAYDGAVLALAHRDVQLFSPGSAPATPLLESAENCSAGRILQLHLGPDLLLSLSEDEHLRLYQRGETSQLLREIALGAAVAAVLPDWSKLQAWVGFAEGRSELWDLRAGLRLRDLELYPQGIESAWRDGERMLVLDDAGQLWSSGTRVAAEVAGITSVHTADNGLFVGTEVGEIHHFDPQGTLLRTWEAHDEAVCSLSGASDGSWLASATAHQPRLWNLAPSEEGEDPEEGDPLPFWQEEVFSQAVSPQGRWLACGGGEGQVVLRSLEDGRILKTLEAHEDCVTCLTFREDEETLASGGADGLVLVWDPRQGEILATLDGHDESITALAYAAGGQLLSGSCDGLITVWDPESEMAIAQLEGFESGVISLTVTRRGDMLLAHYEGGHCLVWDLTRWQR